MSRRSHHSAPVRRGGLLAKALIPGESEWNGYARTFVAAVIRQCKATKRTDPAELWRLVAVASTDELLELLQGTAAQPFLEPRERAHVWLAALGGEQRNGGAPVRHLEASRFAQNCRVVI